MYMYIHAPFLFVHCYRYTGATFIYADSHSVSRSPNTCMRFDPSFQARWMHLSEPVEHGFEGKALRWGLWSHRETVLCT